MKWLRKRSSRKPKDAGKLRTGTKTDVEHLAQFIASRRGVEAYVEPQTVVTDTTILLVAADGEWTRRRVNGPDGAAEFAKRHSIPLYDASRMGYPQRMREYNQRQRDQSQSEQRDQSQSE